MIGKSSSDAAVVTMPEVLEILEARKKGGELGYEQQLAYDYVKKFTKISEADAKKMRKEIEELELSPKVAAKVVDIMPLDQIQLRQALILEKKTVADDVVVKVMVIVEKYRGK